MDFGTYRPCYVQSNVQFAGKRKKTTTPSTEIVKANACPTVIKLTTKGMLYKGKTGKGIVEWYIREWNGANSNPLADTMLSSGSTLL